MFYKIPSIREKEAEKSDGILERRVESVKRNLKTIGIIILVSLLR